MIGAAVEALEFEASHEQFKFGNVGIVIVSHSPKVAEGTADMVRQMVGDEVPLAWTGGNPDGGLGTNVAGIIAAIDTAWSAAGVAMLVDLGGAETNSEMAIEMLPEDRRRARRRLQRADRRGRGDGGDRGFGRLVAGRRQAHRGGILCMMPKPVGRAKRRCR